MEVEEVYCVIESFLLRGLDPRSPYDLKWFEHKT